MKKYFIGVLAALMLFAFTACEPQAIYTGAVYNDVISAEVQQVKGYLEGETAAENGFQIVVTYSDGSTKTIAGNKGTIDLTTTTGLAQVAKSLSFVGTEGQNILVVPAEVVYTDVTSVTVSGAESVKMIEGAKLSALTAASFADAEALDDITFTLSGGDVSKTFTMSDVEDGKITVVLSLWNDGKMLATDTAVKADETYSVTLDKYDIGTHTAGQWDADFTNGDKEQGLSTGVTVSVVKAKDPATVDGIKVYYTVKDGTTVIADKVTTLPALYTGDTVEISVYEVKSDDTEVLTKNTVTVVNATTPNESLSFSEGVGSVTVATKTDAVSTTAAGTVQVKVGDKYFAAPYSVAAGANYISNVSVAATSSKTVKAGETLAVTGENSAITVTVEYKDTENAPATSSGVNSTLSPNVVPANLTGTFTTICTTTYTGRGGAAKSVQTQLTYTVGN